MHSPNTHLWAENWDECFGIKCDLFPAGFNSGEPAYTKFLWMDDVALVIGIDVVGLSNKRAAQGESDWTAGQIKQVGSINVQVECRELGCVKISPMERRKFD